MGSSARTVHAVNSTTQVTLSEAFGGGLTPATWEICKSVKDIGLQLCILHRTVPGDAITQIQHGTSHLVLRRCTHIGKGWLLRTNALGFGVHGVAIKDCIFESMFPDTGSVFPPDGTSIDNNVFETGGVRGTNGIPGNGAGTSVNPANDYRPFANSVANEELVDARNYLGYDALGEVTDTSQSNKSIGAVGEPEQ